VLGCGLAIAVPGIVGYELLAAKGLSRIRLARAGQDALVSHFRTMIGGFRELKSHQGRLSAFLDASLEPTAEAVRDHNVAAATHFAAAGSWSQIAFFGVLGVLLFVLPALQEIPRPALAGTVLVVLYIMSPLDVILTWIPILSRARVSLLAIESLGVSIQAEEELSTAQVQTVSGSFRSALELQGVTYAYRHKSDQGRAEFTLGPIDLILRPGEIVFLSGGNGSGKTTLVKLLAGFYAPDAGTIRLDGLPIAPESLGAYRQLFTVVFADGHLFPNLLGLDLDTTRIDARAREILARLELDQLVRVENGVFSTIDLSQGQRKRLALLAAILEDRPVVVLDEWASNQDAHFKNIFYRELLPEWRARGKTLLVITHDDDFAPIADRVVRLDAGRLADDAFRGHRDRRVINFLDAGTSPTGQNGPDVEARILP
jgi:putative ATP-binding cassette transporter